MTDVLIAPCAILDGLGIELQRYFIRISSETTLNQIKEIATNHFNDKMRSSARAHIDEPRLYEQLRRARKLVIADPISYEAYKALPMGGMNTPAKIVGYSYDITLNIDVDTSEYYGYN